MGIAASNLSTRRFLKLFRRKPKFMPPEESQRWQDELRSYYRSEFGLEFHPMQCNESVIPSAEVVSNVQGNNKSDPNTFFGTSCRDTLRYLMALRDHGYDIRNMERMLDLGVGLGRIMLNFLPFSIERHGCDVNPLAYEWTSKTLGQYAQLRQSKLEPPLDYDDASFDLVIATSVFTHTPHNSQPGWIAELHRVLKPGGIALVTVHDPSKTPGRVRGGWFEVGNDKGVHMNTFLTEGKISELWNASLNFRELRRWPPNQALVVASKPA